MWEFQIWKSLTIPSSLLWNIVSQAENRTDKDAYFKRVTNKKQVLVSCKSVIRLTSWIKPVGFKTQVAGEAGSDKLVKVSVALPARPRLTARQTQVPTGLSDKSRQIFRCDCTWCEEALWFGGHGPVGTAAGGGGEGGQAGGEGVWMSEVAVVWEERLGLGCGALEGRAGREVWHADGDHQAGLG